MQAGAADTGVSGAGKGGQTAHGGGCAAAYAEACDGEGAGREESMKESKFLEGGEGGERIQSAAPPQTTAAAHGTMGAMSEQDVQELRQLARKARRAARAAEAPSPAGPYKDTLLESQPYLCTHP